MLALLAPLAVVFVITTAGVGTMVIYARRAGLMAVPNHRSSHTASKPTGGGLILVLCICLFTFLQTRGVGAQLRTAIVAVELVVLVVTWIGWYDDHGSAPVTLRATAHFVAGAGVAAFVATVHPLTGMANLAWITLWVFWTVASINIVNFMDGIDGMIATQGVIYGAFLFFLRGPELTSAKFGVILFAACLGFLIWNWAPARIFMGDVGSGPLGLFFAFGGALALEGARPTIVFLPLFPIYLDAFFTLLMRASRREKLTEAHRSHLYQRVANTGVGHAPVTIAFALAASVGAIVAILLKDSANRQLGMGISAYCLAVVVLWKVFDRRYPIGSRQINHPDWRLMP